MVLQEIVNNKIKQSELKETGFIKTSKRLSEYLEKLLADINNHLPGAEKLIGGLWSYRHNGYPFISLDIQDGQSIYAMTLTVSPTGDTANYDNLNDPTFNDISELMHLVGLLSRALNMKIIVGLEDNQIMQGLEEPC
jgi:hypothetical protein